jgi:hypothetical protein
MQHFWRVPCAALLAKEHESVVLPLLPSAALDGIKANELFGSSTSQNGTPLLPEHCSTSPLIENTPSC